MDPGGFHGNVSIAVEPIYKGSGVAVVYCWKCGAENDEDAVNCKSCGASLHPPPRRVYRRRYEDQLCFRPGRGVHLIGVFFGLLLILAGVTSLLKRFVWWASWDRLWPFVVVLFGLLIIVGALSKR